MLKGFVHAALCCGAVAAGVAGLTGCQVDVAGQTLPSPWYMTDDVQYFAPGPEFKLQNEANAMRQYQPELQPAP